MKRWPKFNESGDLPPGIHQATLRDVVEHFGKGSFQRAIVSWCQKTVFLTLLYNDIIYIMASETEIDRRYADLTMIIRPDKRYGKVFDVLIEFKFIKLKGAGMSADQAVELTDEELCRISEIAKQIKDGEKQVKEYALD